MNVFPSSWKQKYPWRLLVRAPCWFMRKSWGEFHSVNSAAHYTYSRITNKTSNISESLRKIRSLTEVEQRSSCNARKEHLQCERQNLKYTLVCFFSCANALALDVMLSRLKQGWVNGLVSWVALGFGHIFFLFHFAISYKLPWHLMRTG